jgi:carbamoyltransferase
MIKGYILGIACGYHDSAASLIKDGRVLGAVEEERFTGIKHDSSFPTNTIKWLLEYNKITPEDIEVVCFYDDPKKKLDRIEKSTKRGGITNFLKRQSIISRNKKEFKEIENKIYEHTHKDVRVVWGDHHLSHVAYSYYTSPYDKAGIVSVDGVGEWETTSLYYVENNTFTKIQSVDFPHSLGMLYSAFTAFLGFKPNEGEYKVMGLAPYGDYKKYLSKFSQLISPTDDGGYEINMKYFTYDWDDSSMFNEKLGQLLGLPNRLPEDEITQDHKDLAATLQHEYEHYFFRLVNRLYGIRPSNNLCLGGGCAYNGTANGKILNKTNYKNVWIPSAPSDAGSAIGCALYHYYTTADVQIKKANNQNPYLGPHYSNDQIRETLEDFTHKVTFHHKLHHEIIELISKQITEGLVIGWFEGKMEFGSRALGNRSILANPCDPQMKAKVNKVIKKREGFRPFAPIVKIEEQTKYFDYKEDVPYMNQVVPVKKEHQKFLPAITHVDGSARIQSLKQSQHNRIYKLLNQLQKDNGYPIVLNTSFNLKDQTMVLDPKSAIETFLNCEMDTLVIGNYVVKKKVF